MHLDKRHSRFLTDSLLWVLATPIAFWLRVDQEILTHLAGLKILFLIGIPLKLFTIWISGFHHQSWRKVGVRDLYVLARAVLGVTIVLFVVGVFIQEQGVRVPRSAPLIEGMFVLLALSGVRIFSRWLHEQVRKSGTKGEQKTILIAGAGEAGTMLAREMLRHPEAGLKPVGFVDEAPEKRKQKFLGLPVLGGFDDLPGICSQYEIDEILISMPSASGAAIRRIVSQANITGTAYRIMPSLHAMLSGKVSISQLRDVDVEDLLRRDPVLLDTKEIASYISGKTILITGAGGSIGSEIVRQIADFEPNIVYLLGRGENSIYHIEREISNTHPALQTVAIIADVRDKNRINKLFETTQPQAVFHAAAHKHVPLMEANPQEAIKNNILGTNNIVQAALEFGSKHFVNISTDKAVNPTSIMGASKRIAELVVEAAAALAKPEQVFVSVRFGNVLGSRGSVIPLFKKQIAAGGPVTVTDPDMQRYFMTIPEASQLVLQAGAYGDNGLIYVLDMGQPVKIIDLARDLISLSGLEPDEDIEIEIVGSRPGEKLYEELFQDKEQHAASRHKKIFVGKKSTIEPMVLQRKIAQLAAVAETNDTIQARNAIIELVPTFVHAGSKTG